MINLFPARRAEAALLDQRLPGRLCRFATCDTAPMGEPVTRLAADPATAPALMTGLVDGGARWRTAVPWEHVAV